MIHPNEPTIDELRNIERELFTKESSDDNMKRLHAIGVQIKRRKEE